MRQGTVGRQPPDPTVDRYAAGGQTWFTWIAVLAWFAFPVRAEDVSQWFVYSALVQPARTIAKATSAAARLLFLDGCIVKLQINHMAVGANDTRPVAEPTQRITVHFHHAQEE